MTNSFGFAFLKECQKQNLNVIKIVNTIEEAEQLQRQNLFDELTQIKFDEFKDFDKLLERKFEICKPQLLLDFNSEEQKFDEQIYELMPNQSETWKLIIDNPIMNLSECEQIKALTTRNELKDEFYNWMESAQNLIDQQQLKKTRIFSIFELLDKSPDFLDKTLKKSAEFMYEDSISDNFDYSSLKNQKQNAWKSIERLAPEISIKDYMIDHIQKTKQKEAFYVIDIAELNKKHLQWKQALPKVHPFYAVKCNDDPMIVSYLASLGLGFDCASQKEIEIIQDLGHENSEIIFANTCKQKEHIKYAYKNGVDMMTFDNEEELIKIKSLHPNAKLVLRVGADSSRSQCNLGLKFGAMIEIVPKLLQKAKELGSNVIGISFHVGSGCYDPTAFSDALALAKNAFLIGENLGFKFSQLDIGGGFPGTNDDSVTFEDIAFVINESLDKHFSMYPDLQIIAEPGRYYATTSHTLAVNVYAKKSIKTSDGKMTHMYYVNDGVYGSFNSIIYDYQVPVPKVLKKSGFNNGAEFESIVWGPTCDSMDKIAENILLPELEIDDWLYFDHMGSYTISAASVFNGMDLPRMTYINKLSEDHDID